MPTPITERFQEFVPATAQAADYDQSIAESHVAGTVTEVSYTPEAAITGDSTNGRTMTLVNKGQAGAGTTVIATLALTTGVNAVGFDESQFTLSATAANLVVAVGDILAFVSTHTGTGVADPGGRVEIEIARSA